AHRASVGDLGCRDRRVHELTDHPCGLVEPDVLRGGGARRSAGQRMTVQVEEHTVGFEVSSSDREQQRAITGAVRSAARHVTTPFAAPGYRRASCDISLIRQRSRSGMPSGNACVRAPATGGTSIRTWLEVGSTRYNASSISLSK